MVKPAYPHRSQSHCVCLSPIIDRASKSKLKARMGRNQSELILPKWYLRCTDIALWLEPEAGILPAENTNADILVPSGTWRHHQQLPTRALQVLLENQLVKCRESCDESAQIHLELQILLIHIHYS